MTTAKIEAAEQAALVALQDRAREALQLWRFIREHELSCSDSLAASTDIAPDAIRVECMYCGAITEARVGVRVKA